MSHSGAKEPSASISRSEVEPLSPAALAEHVTLLVGDQDGIRGGELPMWGRLGQSPRHHKYLRRLNGLVWCVAIGLLAVAVLRLTCHDAIVPLVWLNAFTLYIYLPAYFVLAFAASTRRWWLAGVSAAIVACHIAWVFPDFRSAIAYVPPKGALEHVEANQSRPIKIFFANVHGGTNFDMDAVLAEAQRDDPDVIVLAEMQRYWWHQMIDRNPLKAYPYGTDLWHRNAGDVGVFSRLPVKKMEQIFVEDRTGLLVEIPLGSESLRLFALHSPRPMLQMKDDYFKFWERIESELSAQHGPIVMVGDFNATQHSRTYQQLKADGLRSAHEDRGRGYATTWPNGELPLPPIRIDQAFLSPEVKCLSIQEGEGHGSDHKSLLLEIRVHASAPATQPSSDKPTGK